MKSMQNSSFEKTGANSGKLDITVGPERFEEGLSSAYKKNVGKTNIPGFRKGKAPRKMVEQYYGPEFLYEDAFEFVFPDAYRAAVEQHSLDVIDRPELEITEIGKEDGVKFSAIVTLKPEVELGHYKGVEVDKFAYHIEDEQVDMELASVQERNARYVNVEREAQEGDRVMIDYTGTIDGVEFEGGSAENQPLDLGAGRFIPGFEEQVVGMKVGEERDLDVKFPEEYHAKEMAGKDAVFHVVLHAVKQKELPELDDEFAKDISEFDTIEEYKADVRARMEKQAQEKQAREVESAVVAKVVDNATVEVPDVLIRQQYNGIMEDLRYQLAYQGLKIEDYYKYSGMDEEKMFENYREDSTVKAKTQLVLEKITQIEDIQVSEQEIKDEIASIAEQAKQPLERYEEYFQNENREYLKGDLLFKKTVKWLVDGAVVTEKEPLEPHHEHDENCGCGQHGDEQEQE
ncbi:MAG: trigger factor [Christensenellales bacterium]|jgi:trigger factor